MQNGRNPNMKQFTNAPLEWIILCPAEMAEMAEILLCANTCIISIIQHTVLIFLLFPPFLRDNKLTWITRILRILFHPAPLARDPAPKRGGE